MSARVFVDANVLVYAHDVAEPRKRAAAIDALDALAARHAGLLSTQVLAEFFTAATHRIPVPLTVDDAAEEVRRFASLWNVAAVTPLIVIEAIRGVRVHRLSYWDAQIWATARLNQAQVVLTEDCQDGRIIEGIQFRNPFAPTFDLATLAPSL